MECGVRCDPPVTAAEGRIPTYWDDDRQRPLPGRWYKVASRTDRYWPDDSPGTALTPEPGMS